MRNAILLSALFILSACTTSQQQLGCEADAIAVPLATAGAGAAAALDPAIAPEVVAASAADKPLHAAVQDACNKLAPVNAPK